MELYLDSANPNEISAAFNLGIFYGLTTTPTFLQRQGVANVDAWLLETSKHVPVIQVEALGSSASEIVAEAHRLLALGMPRETTVFKIPVSLHGVEACARLSKEGIMTNVHLIYTPQQAYMAMNSGATYVCPLVGRLQDQGTDALALVDSIVAFKDRHGYASKVMFSSVRHSEHVRNAMDLGVDAVTVPWSVAQQLPNNHLTSLGTAQFDEDHRRMTVRVADVLRPDQAILSPDTPVRDALVAMTVSGLGAVVLAEQGRAVGLFTDGDLRRLMERQGTLDVHASLRSAHALKAPHAVASSALLNDAYRRFAETKVDQLLVEDESGKALGLIDIQDLNS
ncbi:MAG: transaldolase family protein [Bacteroidota bacterium]|jgi:TalC/MipB family fructose-6-phosphate aldolase